MAVRPVRIVSELGVVSFSESPNAGTKRSWIRVAKTGYWPNSHVGELTISRDDIRQMHHNFKFVTPKAPHRVVVDYNHGTMEPRNPDMGIAAGWFEDLEIRNNGDELWGLVEWTDKAAGHIRAKEYRGVSPTIAFDYTYKDNKYIGTTLLAAAITNHPFIEDLEDLTVLALSDADRQAIGSRPVKQRTTAMRIIKVKDRNGAEIEIDADSIASDFLNEHPVVVELRSKLPRQGDHVVPAAEFTSLSQSVSTLQANVTSLSTQLSDEQAKRVAAENALASERADQRVAELLRDGLIKSDDETKSFAKKMALSNDFEAWKKTLVKVVPLHEVHGSDSNESVSGDVVKMFNDKVEAHHTEARRANPKAKYVDSVRAVSMSDRVLAQAYHRAVNQPVGKGGIAIN